VLAALLDTCVLWPSLQRDFLLSLAVEGIYRPLWSAAILQELAEHETRKLVRRGEEPAKSATRTRYLLEQMRCRFNDAEVHHWEDLEGSYGLPDPDDEHVVTAAVVRGCRRDRHAQHGRLPGRPYAGRAEGLAASRFRPTIPWLSILRLPSRQLNR